ncbi:hypothetical protein LEP1GSC088_2137 [Leptospira interrogans str. L1207]|nr:hypothetical protein LEP1GSC088_2137 [Leptospira interrogans str. L1207]
MRYNHLGSYILIALHWSGWRQGESEFWFYNVWLPFWENLGTNDKILYLEYWIPPVDWNLYLAQH